MSIHLGRNDLINTQQMEVAVNGPDGATHLILCTGIAVLVSGGHGTYTFLVGPELSRRQFVGAIASGGISTIQYSDKNMSRSHAYVLLEANLISIAVNYDEVSSQVKVSAEVSSGIIMTKLAISYNVNILAELPF